MGEYADDAIERDLNLHLEELDGEEPMDIGNKSFKGKHCEYCGMNFSRGKGFKILKRTKRLLPEATRLRCLNCKRITYSINCVA